MQSAVLLQAARGGWLQLLADSALLQMYDLAAYDGGPDIAAEIDSRLDHLGSGAVSAPGLLRVVQALVAQARQGDGVNAMHAQETRHLAEDLVRECPPGDSGRGEALFLSVVATAIVNWNSGQEEDLNYLITHLIALLDTLHDPDALVGALRLLADALFERFTIQRNLDDLDNACAYLDTAHATDSNEVRRATTLTKLGVALSTRFDMIGRMSDLEQAIFHHRTSTQAFPLNDKNLLWTKHHLGNDLVKRFEHMESKSDLEEAQRHQLDCVGLLPETDPLRYHALVSLGRTLIVQCRQVPPGEISLTHRDNLNRAVEVHRTALAMCPIDPVPTIGTLPKYTQRVMCMISFLFCLRVVVEKLRDWRGTSVVAEAIGLGMEVQKMLPEGHPSLVGVQRDLGFLHLHLEEPMVDSAFHFFRRAVGQDTGSAKERLSAAVDWASCARENNSQHEFLARPSTRIECATLVADAAAFAIDNGRNDQAVEILEQGRTFIWSRMRGYRHPLDQLRKADPTRAEAFQRLSGDVERFAVTFESTTVGSSTFSPGFPRAAGPTGSPVFRRELAARWTMKLDDIRNNVPGFRNFLRPLPITELWRAAVEGPVIVLNHSKYRSDALILLKRQNSISVSLPGDIRALLRFQASMGKSMYVRFSPADTPRLGRKTERLQLFSEEAEKPRTPETVARLLRAIWAVIVEPIVKKLRVSRVPEMSRIWWCPTGMLGVLPLHAAGEYAGSAKNLPDIYISSYTPTISALITARAALLDDKARPPHLLIVGAPSPTVFLSHLPHVQKECAIARSFVHAGETIIGDKATVETVLEQLPKHSWVHFATHAVHNQTQPLESVIVLHDAQLLSLRDFMTAHPPQARLAVVAACDSAAITITPDEVLHLSAAIQFSGFCSVVGSLWYMMDHCGPDLAEEFYKFLLRNGEDHVALKDSAEALNKATRALRDNGIALDHWVNFVHIGV
ncbi:CHAT domain-containing protein [Mycena polygramma]|nr:CHAT domain-containing protein [Mycena polygramma]